MPSSKLHVIVHGHDELDNQTALRLKKKLAEEFRDQLTFGAPNNADEAGLLRLAAHLKSGRLVVKLFLRHQLHAKLYLHFPDDAINPMIGYLGRGELNVDVLDHDAATKLARWFDDRWNDRWCVDISAELIHVIEQSWAREVPLPPYQIYVKMAYHLSQEARAGLSEFRIPPEFGHRLFDYQVAAVKIAAHHLNKRGGVLIGDVVGLGKTLMATALAKIFQDDHSTDTLIICPKNLVKMWEDYVGEYRLLAKVLSIAQAAGELPNLRHSLQQDLYRPIKSASVVCARGPGLGHSPRAVTTRFGGDRVHPAPPIACSLPRRVATMDTDTGRKFLTFEDGTRSYFPERVPKTVQFKIDARDPTDQYARFYAADVVATINSLNLPRYGLANYVAATPRWAPTPSEAQQLQDLSRAGKRLMGFCRTNLFKRLESSGEAFQQSIERHILRNFIFLHAIENGLPLPIGTQDSGLLDAGSYDEDPDDESANAELFDESNGAEQKPSKLRALRTADDFRQRAAEVYQQYATQLKSRFKWLRSDLFVPSLAKDLASDAAGLLDVLERCGDWKPEADAKLDALFSLLTEQHPDEKVIIFTQFADTVRYLETQLRRRGLKHLAGVTGGSEDPTSYAWRFSPESNKKRGQITRDQELRTLVATDVLSEGQNLQDAAIVVNFDLSWAIIWLIQRAGRVDRIGQKSEKILCYSFLPADGVENLIRLRARVRQRLHENAEVVGTDEAFFGDERERQKLIDLYNEKAGILDGDAETEVDLASYAYQIWKNAIDRFPDLQKVIPDLPSVVYSTRPHHATETKPNGVLLYVRTSEGNDALAWVDTGGLGVTESQFEILKAAECSPDTPALPRQEEHHNLVRKGVELIAAEEKTVGGQLGRPSGARFRTYERLKRYAEQVRGTLFETQQLAKTVEEVYRYSLRQSATDTLNRQLRAGITDDKLAELVMALRDDDRLCVVHEEQQSGEPQIICSLGLASARISET